MLKIGIYLRRGPRRGDVPTLRIAAGRGAWVHVARGMLGGRALRAGAGAAVTDQRILEFAARSEAEVLMLDVDELEVTYRYA